MSKLRLFILRETKIQHIWLALPLAISFIALNFTPLREGDLWLHIKVGEQAIHNWQVPRLDQFTFTAYQQPYLFSHSWLGGIALFIVEKIGGLPLLVALQATINTLIVALLLRASVQRGVPAALAATLTSIAWVGLYPYSSARPQIFSFLFFALYIALCNDYTQRGKNRLWLLPIVMALWINFHGAWVMGIMVWLITVGGVMLQSWWRRENVAQIRPLLGWGIAAILVLPLNPEGFAIYRSLLSAGSNPINQQFVSEWQPLVITNILSWVFFGLLTVWIVGLAYTEKRPQLYEVVLMLIFAALSLRYLRMPPFFYILAVPIIAETLTAANEWRNIQTRLARVLTKGNYSARRFGIINTIILLTILPSTIISLPQLRLALSGKLRTMPNSSLISDYFPVQAVAAMPQLRRRIFSLPEWGGYLIWAQYPPSQVFVDGRVELFPIQVWNDYLHIVTVAENWHDLLDQYSVNTLILSKERQKALIEAARKSDWVVLTEDAVAVILVRHDEGVAP